MTPARSRHGQVAGVCAGLAKAYGRDVRAIRLLFLLAPPISGTVYIILWALKPEPEGDR